MSVILNNRNQVVATVKDMQSGAIVEYGYLTSKERINANICRNLVNPKIGKISNNKKYGNIDPATDYAVPTNENSDDSFLVSSWND